MATSHLFLLLSLAATMMLFAVQGQTEHPDEMLDGADRSSPARPRRRPSRAGPSPDSVYGIASYARSPRKKQSNPALLKEILGKDFDENWMSVERPKHLVVEPNFDAVLPSHHKMWAELKKLNMSHNLRPALDSAAVSAVEQWLMKKASCPVRFVWEDVGQLFWPRWIRRGECINSSGERGCSWPAGMHCVPAESITINVLRWNCRSAQDRRSSVNRRHLRFLRRADDDIKCQWTRIPYPVTAECFCSC